MVLVNGTDVLDNTNLLDKAGDDTHTGVFQNNGNVIAQGALFSTVGDAGTGSAWLNNRISCSGRKIIIPFAFYVPKVSIGSPYWAATYQQVIAVPYLFGTIPTNVDFQGAVTYISPVNCSSATANWDMYDLSGVNTGPWAITIRVTASWTTTSTYQPACRGLIYIA